MAGTEAVCRGETGGSNGPLSEAGGSYVPLSEAGGSNGLLNGLMNLT